MTNAMEKQRAIEDAVNEFAIEFGREHNSDRAAELIIKCSDELCSLLDERGVRRGTCKDVGIPGDFACSACGARMFTENNDGHTMCLADEMTIIESPNYCPNCGREVVDA